MPVLLSEPESLSPVEGIRLASCNANIYSNERDDLFLMEIAAGGNSAVVQTKNVFAAAPVIVTRKHLESHRPRYCLVNAGNANAGTGDRGIQDALQCCKEIARVTGCEAEQVLPFSTGVIGEYLPVRNISEVAEGLVACLDQDRWLDCARAMMTTDTVAKGASRTVMISGKEVVITGIAKGSGMIRPDMATMLAYVATDAAIDQALLEQLLQEAVDSSFNRICVDGDTSTNDACLLIASGASGVEPGRSASDLVDFRTALNELCIELAQAIVRDGEGATKFITVEVKGATSEKLCREVAYDIATSPLVKTAMFASDPNWGRIIAAIGRSRGDELQAENISVSINDVCVLERGGLSDSYTEEAGQREMNRQEIHLAIELGPGEHGYTAWTCDLSHDYVSINADYRS